MPSILIFDDSGEIILRGALKNADKFQQAVNIIAAETQEKQSDPVPVDDFAVSIVKTINSAIEYPELSKQEFQVLKYISNAFSPGQTAVHLGITVRTVRKHLDSLKKKFHANSRDQMMARAGYLKLCDPYQKNIKH